MDLMQNCILDKTTPFDVKRIVLSRQVYFVAEKFDRGRKWFVLGSKGQISARSLTGANMRLI